ncbi:hypothetical protein F511_42184 [Dorcoceras hygrometricum]|uniref:Dystroglycan-like n=1 Tax=Dorcoceras hygrometricum TaxID=472368 RepID=A0A2Z7D5J5_9LAMI|nr:hypothetical protein F511_42184 [Dorcoceras hygrometricum]
MAASFYSNSVHVYFDFVLAMNEPDMVSMFQALVESGLQGFLGCTTVVYEEALVEFFANGAVRDGLVVSSVNGVSVEISEKLFAETFDLPVVGLADVSEMPKDNIFDARSIVSMTGEPVILSGSKSQMKIHYRLLCDIMAKSISVKAGSFNALKVEKFSLLTAVVCDVKMNWGSVLFGILKKMVTPGSKQAKGFAIQLSLLLESFPDLGLGESSEFPSSKILTEKATHRYIAIIDKSGAQEPADAPKVKKAPSKKVASKKRPADISFDVPVLKKKRTSNRRLALETVVVAQEAIPIQSVHVSTAVAPLVEDQQVDFSEELPADELPAARSAASTEERHWFDLSYDELLAKWAAERPITYPADSDDEIKDDEPVVNDPDTIINEVLQNLDSASDDKHVEPAVEVANLDVVTAGEDQQVLAFLAQSANDDLLDADEQKSLEDILLEIPVDVPLPSTGMEITNIVMGKTIKIPGVTEKTWFLNSLPSIPADDKGKEILSRLRKLFNGNLSFDLEIFGIVEVQFCTGPRIYRSRSQGYRVLSDRHVSILEELTTTARAHGLIWKKPCCSTVFDGSPRDRGAVIARTNTNTRSSCWIRTMILVDGVWTVEPCANEWVKIPRQVISNEVHRQRQYDDTLPTVSDFFKLMRKRWADICLEVVEFCASRRLLPIGSLQFCRSSSIVEPVFQVASGQSQIFAFRVSQFCSIFVDFSVFNWFPSADISDFLSSIALDRTAFRSVQIAQSVVPSVQFSLDQRPSSPTTADSYSSLHFYASDVDATVSSLPPVSQDFSAAFADLQAILSEQINESQSGISSKLHKIEQVLRDSLSDQAAIFKNLSQEARQEGRSIDDVQTIRFNEFRKNILAQNASIFVGLADVRKEVQEINAKVDIMASRLNDIQKNAEATKEALSHQLFEFQSQAQENQNILHAQLSELVDYIHRGSADKKGESGSRGLQQPSDVQVSASAERTPTFAQRVENGSKTYVHTVLDADANRALLERQAAAERDRERRRREARMLKRRRRD